MLTEYDDRYDYDEERWQSIGSVKGTLIYVGHTSRIFMKKKLSVSSQPEKLVRVKQEDIVFTEKMQEELRLLKNRKVDLTDPDAPEIIWKNPVVGKFYRPLKQQITLRIDMPVLEWFKKNAKQYQTLINTACIEYMMRHQKPVKTQPKSKRASS
ncbi:MAG: BrnA antitoxin family protein [Gammaproteobacteria bacterium]|nr:BrnA antitoxin family protein [Gammaproteobacteria bacterium]